MDLGDPGREVVRQHLAYGRDLSQRVLATVDLGAGRATTAAPAGTPIERLYEWRHGGLFPEGGGRMAAMEVVARVGATTSGTILIAEDYNGSPSAPWVRTFPGDRFVQGDCVYEYCLDLQDREQTVDCLARANALWIGTGMVARVRPPRFGEDDDYLDEVARNIHLILIEAYDGEGLVIWEPVGAGE